MDLILQSQKTNLFIYVVYHSAYIQYSIVKFVIAYKWNKNSKKNKMFMNVIKKNL